VAITVEKNEHESEGFFAASTVAGSAEQQERSKEVSLHVDQNKTKTRK